MSEKNNDDIGLVPIAMDEAYEILVELLADPAEAKDYLEAAFDNYVNDGGLDTLVMTLAAISEGLERKGKDSSYILKKLGYELKLEKIAKPKPKIAKNKPKK